MINWMLATETKIMFCGHRKLKLSISLYIHVFGIKKCLKVIVKTFKHKDIL